MENEKNVEKFTLDKEKVMHLNTETIIGLTAIIDKMGIANDLRDMQVNTGDEKKDREMLGKQLVILFISKLYKAKDEVYDLIANYKGITPEEAKKVEPIPIIKEILGFTGALDFLA